MYFCCEKCWSWLQRSLHCPSRKKGFGQNQGARQVQLTLVSDFKFSLESSNMKCLADFFRVQQSFCFICEKSLMLNYSYSWKIDLTFLRKIYLSGSNCTKCHGGDVAFMTFGAITSVNFTHKYVNNCWHILESVKHTLVKRKDLNRSCGN